jgi:hypothetical protein
MASPGELRLCFWFAAWVIWINKDSSIFEIVKSSFSTNPGYKRIATCLKVSSKAPRCIASDPMVTGQMLHRFFVALCFGKRLDLLFIFRQHGG